jgi:hypothetical protein
LQDEVIEALAPVIEERARRLREQVRAVFLSAAN